MKRIVTLPLILLLTLGAASVAVAGDGDQKMDVESAKGVIAGIDADVVIVEVEKADGTTTKMTFNTDDKTKVIKNGTKITLSDLSEGESVSITYMMDGDKMKAVAIGIV